MAGSKKIKSAWILPQALILQSITPKGGNASGKLSEKIELDHSRFFNLCDDLTRSQ